MTKPAFQTAIEDDGQTLKGPWRRPHQMLNAQVYDSHASIHDNATAQKLGFKGGTIEGPTHFSQFAPLCEHLFGQEWFETGCISAHYRNAVYEGEEVQAVLGKPPAGARRTTIAMFKRDGTEVLRGSVSVGPNAEASALDLRLSELKPLADPVILRDVQLGLTTPRRRISMSFDTPMGDLYPFSLREKLDVITEPSRFYDQADHSWSRPIIPIEMLSVLFQYTSKDDPLPVKGPTVGLFADQEIKLIAGPLFVGETYEIERQVVAMSGSRRTESLWVRTHVYDTGAKLVGTMLLNVAQLKESYAPYDAEYLELYGRKASEGVGASTIR